jgi:Uma2 family endonuclease
MDVAKLSPDLILYPESDSQPMTESDATRDYLIYAVEVLRLYFQRRRNVYVSGNLFIYYEEGNPKAVVSPDVFVVFGVSPGQRKSYKTWQEGGKLPAFVLEITSASTRKQDETEKPALYQSLGIPEYFQYDPTADYLRPQLKGRRLANGVYQPLPLEHTAEGVSFIASQSLGLDLQLRAGHDSVASLPRALRFYDPQTGLTLLNRQEVEQERDAALQRAQRLAEKLRELGINPDQV